MQTVRTPNDETGDMPRLSLKVRDFGPIESADISLKPLTILLGPNNCGKSHIAKLIHSVINCESRLGTTRFFPFNPPDATMNKILDMAKCVDNGEEAHSDVVGDLMKVYMSNFFPHVLLNSLSAASWGDVVRTGSKSFSIEICSDITHTKIHGTDESLAVDATAPGIRVNPNLKIPYSSDSTLYIDEAKNELRYSIPPPNTSYIKHPGQMMSVLMKIFENYAMRNTFRSSRYIPGERAGILDMYRFAVGGMLDTTSPYGDTTDSTTKEFMAQLLFLNDKPGIFADLVDKMEAVMTGGKIDVSRHQMVHVSDIHYVYNGHKIPIHAASSSIKSVAQLFLQLKYGMTSRDLLILEEPEAGLDLDNQAHLASLVARLVHLGLCLVVTTHSVYFIDKMSNCLRSGMLRADGHEHSIISKDESISDDKIAVYQFDRSDHTRGYGTTLAEITAYSGIEASAPTKTDDKLYKELLALDMQTDKR